MRVSKTPRFIICNLVVRTQLISLLDPHHLSAVLSVTIIMLLRSRDVL